MKKLLLTLTLLGACTQVPPLARDVLIPGPKGDSGLDGQGCSVTPVLAGDLLLPNGGAIVLCGTNSVLISNGAAGSNGTNGLDAPSSSYNIVGLVDPCDDAPGLADEVFLKLANGQMVWLQVDNGSALTARLSLASPGSFTTTDNSHCHFTINNDLTISNEHY